MDDATFEKVCAATAEVERTKAHALGFLGGPISDAYKDAVRAHHNALVKRCGLMNGPEAAKTLRKQANRSYKAIFRGLASVS